MLLRLAASIVCLASFVPCQEGESDVRSAQEERRLKAAAGESGDKSAKGEIDDERLTPEERLARHITSGAQAYCRFFASVTPSKLMPGQTGTLKILATLQGHAVIPSPARLEMIPRAQQGAISLGGMVVQPAEVGRLEKGYLGRPVYENYAVMEVPVTMAPTAVLGSKHAVAVDMKFDLYDGNSAQPIGRFLDHATTEIEVGKALDPEVKGMARRPTVVAPAPSEPPAKSSEPQHPVAVAPTPPPLQGKVLVPEPAVPAAQPAVPDSPTETLPLADDGDGMPVPLLVGGGALLLGVVFLLARKK